MSVERIYFEQIKKLEQENKQLKDSNFTLKKMQQDLEESMDYDEDVYDLVTEKNRLKQKLEKIRDLLHLKQSEGYAYVNDYDLLEILGDKK